MDTTINAASDNEVLEVKKKKGTKERFSLKKIEGTIRAAFEEKNIGFTERIKKNVFSRLQVNKSMSSDEIQDIVENAIFDSGFPQVARAYKNSHHEKQFVKERLTYMDRYSTSTESAAQTSETDPNANVTIKNVANLEGEVYKTTNRVIHRQRMRDKLNELFPEVAKQYEEDLNHHIIYAHDESQTPAVKAYCMAATLYPLMLEGTGNIDGVTPSPPNDIQSFSGQVTNLVFLLSSQVRGACLYKDQPLIIRKDGIVYKVTAKELVNAYLNNSTIFTDSAGTWETSLVNHLEVLEDDRFVPVKRVFRRQYTDNIYKIKTADNHTAYTSKDHLFKVKLRGRYFTIKAEELSKYDTVAVNKNYSCIKETTSADFKKGWIHGMLCGDGYIAEENNIGLSVNHKQEYLGDIFNAYLDEVYHVTLYKRDGHGRWTHHKYSKDLYNALHNDIIGNTTYDKHIEVKGKSLSYLLGFLDGLLCADGSYTQSRGIAVSLTNKALAENVYDIVSLLDINYNGVHVLEAKGRRKESYYQYIPSRIVKYLHHTLKKKTVHTGDTLKDNTEKINEVYHCGRWADSKTSSNAYKTTTEHLEVIDCIETFANDDNFVYEIETESHWYNCGGFITHNCALGDYCVALNFYVVQEFGSDWYEKLDQLITTDCYKKPRTVKDAIRKGMKQFIYGVNQPAGNRSYNSPFSNLNFFDKYYYKALFDEFYYPDGTKPEWKAIDCIQRMFMELLRELRLVKPLTFPVTSVCMLHDNEKCLDEDCRQWVADEWAKGSSFFLYLSNNPTSISSCCFSKDTKFLWKSSTAGVKCTTFEEFTKLPYDGNKEDFKVYHSGSWIDGKVITLPNRQLYRVVTENNNEYFISDNHINVTYDGEKPTSKLTTKDYLKFNNECLTDDQSKENGEYLSYAEGLLVGLFIEVGAYVSYIGEDGVVKSFSLSMNKALYEDLELYLSLLGDYSVLRQDGNDDFYQVSSYDENLVKFLEKWTGLYGKDINLNCLLESYDFRKGIIDGWYSANGRTSNECYTTSPELAFNMQIIGNSLSFQSKCDFNDDRGRYCVKFYDKKYQPKSGSIKRKRKDDSIYWKIKFIEPVDYKDDIYCIECANQDEPYFTLPTGLITHNCRVQNEITENTFSSTIGLTGIMTGSANVITLNLNRIVQDYFRWFPEDCNINCLLEDKSKGYPFLKKYLTEILERVYKYQIAYKTMVYEMEERGMYSCSNAGYIYMKKLYCTIGVIGYCEAAQFLGYKITDNQEYKDFLRVIFETIQEENKKHSIHDKKRPFVFNTEAIPGENLAVKLYEWDKADGYVVPEDQNLYSSYFFRQWDENLSVLDKLRLHNKDVNKYCGGGLDISLAS